MKNYILPFILIALFSITACNDDDGTTDVDNTEFNEADYPNRTYIKEAALTDIKHFELYNDEERTEAAKVTDLIFKYHNGLPFLIGSVGGGLSDTNLLEISRDNECHIEQQAVYFNKFTFEMNETFLSYTIEEVDNITTLNTLNSFECSLLEEMPLQIYYNTENEWFIETTEQTYYCLKSL